MESLKGVLWKDFKFRGVDGTFAHVSLEEDLEKSSFDYEGGMLVRRSLKSKLLI